MAFREEILKAAQNRILYTRHALDQMNKPDRLISMKEVKSVVIMGEIIEDYPEDPRGHSCLLAGKGAEGRPIHVVCSPKKEYLAIATAYVPNREEWDVNFRVRKG